VAYLLDERSAHLNGRVLGFDGAHLELVTPARPVTLPTPPGEWSLDAFAAALAAHR
jgi:hypothetical protein